MASRDRSWQLPEREVTPEALYRSRRRFLRGAVAAAALPLVRCMPNEEESVATTPPLDRWWAEGSGSVPLNDRYPAGRAVTPEETATTINNYYELALSRNGAVELADRLVTRPWTVEVTGLVERPLTLDVDALIARFTLEERIYRQRCVEGWAITVPWLGFPLRSLLELVSPLASATHVRFVSGFDAEVMEGAAILADYPWPYHEGLTIAEATHDLTFLSVGMYGRQLPNQNGAPLRLNVPWKWGYKSIKSIVRIELTDREPPTLWNTVSPRRYDFVSNVDPSSLSVPWSQQREFLLPDGPYAATELYNGYGAWVADLYR
jgi:sulfoxide reductase catalytic subunit YedY